LATTGDTTEPLDLPRTLAAPPPVELIDVGDNDTANARLLGFEAVVAPVGRGQRVRSISAENARS
jgi:hypothetical protein